VLLVDIAAERSVLSDFTQEVGKSSRRCGTQTHVINFLFSLQSSYGLSNYDAVLSNEM